jgi:hypothetical protein
MSIVRHGYCKFQADYTSTPPWLVPLYWSSYLPYASAFVLTIYD